MSGETTITITGNLTNDPEIRYTNTGTAVAGFTIATSSRTYNKQLEQWEDGEALFMRCSAWRDLAEHVCESLTRGTRVIATGRLRMRTYQTSEGDNRTVIEMTVDEIGPSLRFATAKVTKTARTRGNSAGGPERDPWHTTAPAGAPAGGTSGGWSDDEPPF
ncbi:single-stranded DNA-binding protein [Microbispora sp. RL4-1S]|uniref:Single-stranded DNA-binding protein n=1 Tax=Microbispora oryzae TaxID=2806554 RepID=A0A941ANC5_9ACTN|nr:single-stranded DNA-binding protein [Microbispora oryzae]MBP2708208.1 single-stranded DNA-binding protein [Microbispora oryzae]